MGRKRLFNDTEKRCARCKAWLPHAEFFSNKGKPSGLQDSCRECTGKYVDAYADSPGGAAYKLRLLARKRRARAAKLLAEAENFDRLAKTIKLADRTQKELTKETR
jgi:hypothetical protein